MPHLRAVRELFLGAFSADQIKQIDVLTKALRANLGLDGESQIGQHRRE